MHAAACSVAWFGPPAGWHMLKLAMGEAPTASCPGMERRADADVVWTALLHALLAAHAFGASVAAHLATHQPTRQRRGASEIAEAALTAAGPPRDGALHLRQMLECPGSGAELGRFAHGAAVRLLGLHGAAGARAVRCVTWAAGAAGLLRVAQQPSGTEGEEEEGAPDTFRGLTLLGKQAVAQLQRGGGGGGGGPWGLIVEASIRVATAALRTAASGRGPLQAELDGPAVQWLRQVQGAIRLLEQRVGRSPRARYLRAYVDQRAWWPLPPAAPLRRLGAQVRGLANDPRVRARGRLTPTPSMLHVHVHAHVHAAPLPRSCAQRWSGATRCSSGSCCFSSSSCRSTRRRRWCGRRSTATERRACGRMAARRPSSSSSGSGDCTRVSQASTPLLLLLPFRLYTPNSPPSPSPPPNPSSTPVAHPAPQRLHGLPGW